MSAPEVARPLTAGEARIAQQVFGAALNTRLVHIHNRPYFAGQGKRTAMTPNGEVWFRDEDYRSDFSTNLGDAAWIAHELTHAWQYQSGRSVRGRGLLEQASRLFGVDPYKYGRLDRGRAFASYMNEQQAMIVEDYFRILNGHPPVGGSGSLADYRAVIPFAPK